MSLAALSIRTRAALFTFACIAVSLAAGFGILIVSPPPAAERIALAEAVAGVTSMDGDAAWRWRAQAAPPFGAAVQGAALVAQAGLAAALGRPIRCASPRWRGRNPALAPRCSSGRRRGRPGTARPRSPPSRARRGCGFRPSKRRCASRTEAGGCSRRRSLC
jgi:hypothetical protein